VGTLLYTSVVIITITGVGVIALVLMVNSW